MREAKSHLNMEAEREVKNKQRHRGTDRWMDVNTEDTIWKKREIRRN